MFFLQHPSIHTTWNQRNAAISTNPFAHSEYVEGLCHRQGFWNNEPFLFVGSYLSQSRHSWFQESLPNHLNNVSFVGKARFFPLVVQFVLFPNKTTQKKTSLRLGSQSSVICVFEGVIRCFMWSHQRFTPWKFNVDTTNWCCAKCNFISKIAIFGYLYQMYSKFQGRKYWKSNQLKGYLKGYLGQKIKPEKIAKSLAAPERISLCACRQFLDRPEMGGSAVPNFYDFKSQVATCFLKLLVKGLWKSFVSPQKKGLLEPLFPGGGTWNGVDPSWFSKSLQMSTDFLGKMQAILILVMNQIAEILPKKTGWNNHLLPTWTKDAHTSRLARQAELIANHATVQDKSCEPIANL